MKKSDITKPRKPHDAVQGEVLGARNDVAALGRVFVEGGLEHEILILTDDLAERRGQGRPNGTERRGRPS
jgi:hypothetical protein